MQDTDGFTLVTKRGKRGKAQTSAPRPVAASETASNTSPNVDSSNNRSEQASSFYSSVSTKPKRNSRKNALQEQQLDDTHIDEKIIYNITDKRYTLKTSPYMDMLLEQHIQIIQEFAPEEIVCYGIGSPSSKVSQWQLALILELNSGFKLQIWAFDPVTTDRDLAVLEKLNISVIPENEEAKRTAVRRTLFFMPHCEQFLYENVVAANWSKETLGRTMLIGNRVSGYKDAQGEQIFAEKSPHLNLVVDSLSVVEFPSEKALKLRHCPYAFTDTCIQYVEPQKIDLINF